MILPSLLWGLFAWAVPILGRRAALRKLPLVLLMSLTACAASVLSQFGVISGRADRGDLGGIVDTIGVTTLGMAIMIAVTIAINVFVFYKRIVDTQ